MSNGLPLNCLLLWCLPYLTFVDLVQFWQTSKLTQHVISTLPLRLKFTDISSDVLPRLFFTHTYMFSNAVSLISNTTAPKYVNFGKEKWWFDNVLPSRITRFVCHVERQID